MIDVVRAGIGWSVRRDGQLIKREGESGVERSKTSAYKNALEIRKDNPDEKIEVEGGLDGIDLEHLSLT